MARCGRAWIGFPGAGFDAHALEQRYRSASVMAGVLPIGTPPGAARGQAAFFWSIRADRVAAWCEAGLRAWKAEVTSLWPATRELLEQITHLDQLTFASYAHRTVRRPVEQALIHIGDAWHSASPQLGQGANMALLDAYALMLGLRAGGSADQGTALASNLRRRHVLLYQALTGLLTRYISPTAISCRCCATGWSGPYRRSGPRRAFRPR
jgi:salicylate hydroxylase